MQSEKSDDFWILTEEEESIWEDEMISINLQLSIQSHEKKSPGPWRISLTIALLSQTQWAEDSSVILHRVRLKKKFLNAVI